MDSGGQIGPLAVVLFVGGDDEDQVVALRVAGYRVEVIPTALEALERASSLRPDVLIVPLLTPGSSGPALAYRLGARTSAERALAVVLLTTAAGAAPDPVASTTAGAAFCRLPCAPSDLVAMVDGQLAARRAQAR